MDNIWCEYVEGSYEIIMTIRHKIEARTLSQQADYFKMKCPCCGKFIIDPRLYKKLIQLEGVLHTKLGVSVTSGYRCKEHNKAVGGVPNSYHTQGKAIDIYIGGQHYNDKDVVSFVKAARYVGFHRIGWKRYKGVFVHLDVGEYPPKAEW